jgi:hypothetical protein
MAEPTPDRAAIIKAFEDGAEVIAVHQLDLLAQLEGQLRAVHKTMRCIEKLRSDRHRVGPELSNAERADTLQSLANELTAIDEELHIQHQSCAEMQRSIGKMQARLAALRQLTMSGDAER